VREVVAGAALLGIGFVPVWVFFGRGDFSPAAIVLVSVLSGGFVLGGLGLAWSGLSRSVMEKTYRCSRCDRELSFTERERKCCNHCGVRFR
jgi:hypothetical protein